MAEYRELKCPYGDDYEGGDECDRCEQYELCMETSPADVVERSEYKQIKTKLDKIEQIINECNVYYPLETIEQIKEVVKHG